MAAAIPPTLTKDAAFHKWKFGAFAELLDITLDRDYHATSVRIDMLVECGMTMLQIADDGNGYCPKGLRQLMQSASSPFRRGTLRLGGGVLVFTCSNNAGKRTQSVGLLSTEYSRGRSNTDVIIPMVNYEYGESQKWTKTQCSKLGDVRKIIKWSPYTSEEDLRVKLSTIKDHGTSIIIFNLCTSRNRRDELDFDIEDDIQIWSPSLSKDNQNAKSFPGVAPLFTYKHSLRAYCSILYLELPLGVHITIRGSDVVLYDIVQNMTFSNVLSTVLRGNVNMSWTIGYRMEGQHMICLDGCHLYFRNRLIKPFWKPWNASVTDNRFYGRVVVDQFLRLEVGRQSFVKSATYTAFETSIVNGHRVFKKQVCRPPYRPPPLRIPSPVPYSFDNHEVDKTEEPIRNSFDHWRNRKD